MTTEAITEIEEVHNAVPTTDTKPIKFSVTDAAIEEMRIKFMPLVINGPDDKEGYKRVYEARQIVKDSRVGVDKKRKELNEDALTWQRSVNGEAKRITALLETIEDHLEKQEKTYNQERQRIAEAKALEQRMRYQSRHEQLVKAGFAYNPEGDYFHFGELSILVDDIRALSDEEYSPTAELIEEIRKTEQARLAKIKEQQEQETARIAAEQAETARKNKQEAERLQAVADMQAATQRQIEDARKQLEADRRKMIIDSRSPQLIEAGFDWNGSRYKLLNIFRLGVDDVIDMTDGQFTDLLIDAKAKVKAAADQEAERIAREKAADKLKKAQDRERAQRLAPDKKALKKHLLTVFEKPRPMNLQPESIEYLKQLYDGWDAFVKQQIDLLEAL